MQVANLYRTGLIVLLVGGIVPVPARALLKFDDGHDELFATGTLSIAYDSNITATSSGQGDMIYSGGAGLQYSRRAGIISVDASGGISTSHFGKTTSDDFSDPHFDGEFSAKDDRTSADLTLSTARESQADIVAGIRAVSWNDAAGLNVKYRVTDRYSVSGTFNYTLQDFVTNTPLLTNLTSYSTGANLFYTINSARDLFVGYNFGLQETGRGLSYYDHSFNVGIDGKILPKLNGTVSVGYELQDPHGSTTDHATGSTTETVSLTWNFSRRLKITGDLTQNFNAISTNGSVNTIASSLDAIFSMNSKTSLTGGVGGGYNRFIGLSADGRRDTYFTWNTGVNYTINDHFTTSLGYVYYENWSTVGFSDFIRHTITLTLNIRF
jgi:hypothetical protein